MGRTGPPAAAPAGPVKTFKYGMPLYGLAWPEGLTFYMCGGGGSTKTGIVNRLVCAEAAAGALTDQTAEHAFGMDCPTRLVLSPGGRSLVFAMSKGGIRRLDVDSRGRAPKFSEVTGSLEDRLREVKMDVKALAFHPSGDLLALGAEDGSVAVYEWPGMKLKLDLSGERKLPDGVKDLDFMPHSCGQGAGRAGGGRALAVVLEGGGLEVLDLDKQGAPLCKVRPAKGEFKSEKVFTITSSDRLLLHHMPSGMENAQFAKVRCRAVPAPAGASSASSSGRQQHVLVCLLNNRAGSHVTVWELGEDGLLSMSGAGRVADSPGTCMDVSADGGVVAVGTSEGDMVLANTRPRVRTYKRCPKAHMVFTTCIAFNSSASHVISTSADASATVNSTAPPPPPDIKRFLSLFITAITLTMMIVVQILRVLKRRGMTNAQILAMIGLRSKDEL